MAGEEITIEVRPVTPITSPSVVYDLELTIETLSELIRSPAGRQSFAYFSGYPALSLMSDESRVLLYQLVRALNARHVAEIGTLFAGTAEVICRALSDGGGGVLYTTDPFGADRCPAIIAQWPEELRKHCEFFAKDSMAFFLDLQQRRITLDLCLVDGNHDFEFALFDLNMAAKLVRPGGVVVMDNAEQTGPFYATRQFLQHNPGWRELGTALTEFDLARPFDKVRASLPDSTFLLLQKPREIVVTQVPASTTQMETAHGRVSGIRLEVAGGQNAEGMLHLQAILRAFRDGNREVEEYVQIADIPIQAVGDVAVTIEYMFETPMVSALQNRKRDCTHTLELEFSWGSISGPESLHLRVSPASIA